MKPGTLYAVTGEGGWIYYGQVAPDQRVGFFRRRDRNLGSPDEVLSSPIMAVVGVNYPSIGRALRSGRWQKMGRFSLAQRLTEPRGMVQWPVGTLVVTVGVGDSPAYETTVDDPAIQEFEIVSSWDAEHHIPARLTADFGAEEAEWHVGGPIWRERRIKEEMARRYPDQLWHQLPPDWVPTMFHWEFA